MDKDELKRWGFSKRKGNEWYSAHLCMKITVFYNLLDIPLSEYALIHAVYQRGFENGAHSVKENFKQLLEIE